MKTWWSMNRKIKIISLVLLSSILLSACSGQEEKKSDPGMNGVTIEKKDGQNYYIFQDADGNSYEAPLLENVPRSSYNFSVLKTDETTGIRSYTDPATGLSARKGVDVSEFQGEDIDWAQVRDSGIDFAIIRLGYRAYGESGALVLDAMFEKNIQGALDAGLDVGVYFFSQAISASEAVQEAEFVLQYLRPYNITGPVVYDTEDIKWDEARTDINTEQDFTNYCKVFCDTIEQAGYDPMIYSNMKWMAFTLDMEELTDYDFWYADYHDLPQCPYEYKIWQYTENGAVPGIHTNVDLNLWFQEENKE